MAGINWIVYSEAVVAKNHPTLADVANRPLRDLLTLSGWDPDSGSFDIYVLPAGKALAAHAATFDGNVRCIQFDNGNSGAAITIDWAAHGNVQRVTLTSATVTITLSNATAGGVYILEVVQDATGGRAWTWAASPGAVIWPAGVSPIVTTTLNRADLFSFFYDGVPGTAKYVGAVNGQNYAV